MAGKIN